MRWALLAALVPMAAAQSSAMSLEGWGPGDLLRTCISDLDNWTVKAWDKKGITVEDTTLEYCPNKVPAIWPNTLAPMRSIRIFRAWHQDWVRDPEVPELAEVSNPEDAWRNLKRFAINNGAKILLGTSVTCDVQAGVDNDAQDWEYVKQFALDLGPENIFGLAVGNEIDLLYTKKKDDHSVNDLCIKGIWEHQGYFKKFQQRVAEFDELGPGFSDIPVTAVFSAAALYSEDGSSFQEVPGQARVQSFFELAVKNYSKRFAFTFNHYTYFDPNYDFDKDSGDKCTKSIDEATCWNSSLNSRCTTPRMMALARKKMRILTGSNDSLYWVGETGWSWPAPKTLGTKMSACLAWSSRETFERFYRGFLEWDLKIPGERSPDHIFYFAIRSSKNFGFAESFGLIDQCSNKTCRLTGENYTAPKTEIAKAQAIVSFWRKIGFAVIGSLILVSFLGTYVYVSLLPSTWKSSGRRTPQTFSDRELSQSPEETSSSGEETD